MNILKKALHKVKSTIFSDSRSMAIIAEFSKLTKLANDYGSVVGAGYIENVVASTCIRRTCEAMNSIPITFFLNGKEVDSNSSGTLAKEIINSIKRPSQDMNYRLWLETIQSQMFISGEAFIFPKELTSLNYPYRLEPLRPDRINKLSSSDERVHKYTYQRGSKRMEFKRGDYYDGEKWVKNPSNLEDDFNLIILRSYNPVSDITGLSRLASCGFSIQTHNESLKWNHEVVKNSGKPSGIVSFDGEKGGTLDEEQIKALQNKLDNKTTGSNRGKFLVMNSPAKFEKMSFTSQEMDFIEGTVQRSIEICNALDYPPYLLGFTGATFNNQSEAKLSLYENSAIPKYELIVSSISDYYSRRYNVNFEIKLDISRVDAMAPRFQQKNDNIINQYKNNIITLNEAREPLGYEPRKTDGDLFYSDINRNNNIINQNIDS